MVDIGSRTFSIDNCQKATVAVIADLANKWLRERDINRGSVASDQPAASDDLIGKLERLGKLMEAGVLTADEFATAKAKLLAAF